MSHTPTPEQQAIYDAAPNRSHMRIIAGAGAGKTTTIRGVSSLPAMGGRAAYWAYNRAVADDAAASFPSHVACKTGHGFCYRAAIQRFPFMRDRLNMPAQPGAHRARILGVTGPTRITAEVVLAPAQVARIALDTVGRFCYSGDAKIERRHVPTQTGLESPEGKRALAAAITPVAEKAWADVVNPDGQLRWTHDMYVKLAELSGVRLGVDYLLLDEAQDSNAVTLSVAQQQAQAGTQVILVGDPNQALYPWRGSVNILDTFPGDAFTLSKSFRFGPAIAAEANKWLTVLASDLRITGHDPVESTIGPLTPGTVDAILCRTNAEAMRRVMALQESGQKVALVDGKNPGSQMKWLSEACDDLREKGFSGHPELAAFQTWGQVQDFVDHDGGTEFATAVKLIEQYGTDAIIAAVGRLTPERYADVTVTTAHKSKGREWDHVQIADDFKEPAPDGDGETRPSPDEAMLAYVAVTRAKLRLDPGPLSYVNDLLSGAPAATREPVVTIAAPIVCGAPRIDGRYPAMTCGRPAHDDTVPHGPGTGDTYVTQPGLEWVNPTTTMKIGA